MRCIRRSVFILASCFITIALVGCSTENNTSDITSYKDEVAASMHNPSDSQVESTVLQQSEVSGMNSNAIIDESKIKELNYVTAVINPCNAKNGPADEYDNIMEMPYGRLIRITGQYLGANISWLRARLVEGIDEKPDFSEFWININNIARNEFEQLTFIDCNVSSALEYTFVLTSEEAEHEPVELKKLPAEGSAAVAGACGGDLIRVFRDSEGSLFKIVNNNEEWSLVQKISEGNLVDTSNVGWIKTKNYTDYKTGMKTNQGFLLNGVEVLESPDVNAGILDKVAGLAQVFIIKHEGEWLNINSGFNSFNGWVRSRDLKYCLSGEDPYSLANPDIDKKEFVQKIKEELANWKNIRLCAQDINKEIGLTDHQKADLAGKLTAIENIETFDGGYSLIREAIYPFYTLKLLDESGSDFSDSGAYTFTVAGDDKLLIEIPAGRLEEYYGFSRRRMPLRFLTVNKEYISYIRTLIPAPENNNKNDWNYLLNAKKVVAGEVEGNSPQQVYKCARAIRTAAGSEIERAKIPENTEENINFRFEFEDEIVINVLLTDKYISYNDHYYLLKVSFNEIMGMLFAAYF